MKSINKNIDNIVYTISCPIVLSAIDKVIKHKVLGKEKQKNKLVSHSFISALLQ